MTASVVDRLVVPRDRIRRTPAPGTATEADLIATNDRGDGPLCELVDGTLIENPAGFREARLGSEIGWRLDRFAEQRGSGIGMGDGGPVRTVPGRVRIPDAAFFRAEQFPDNLLPTEQVVDLTPDITVEVLSPSNTAREMAEKRAEYFASGTRLVWEIDPLRERVTVYTGSDDGTVLPADGHLDGGDTLPGFSLRVSDVFARFRALRPPMDT